MDLFWNVIMFVSGLVAIVKGADWLTDGAADIAHRYRIPTLVIGLTIVAIGTSAPEFVVSMLGALNKDADIAIGNVVGSNIFNILGMISLTAIVTPITLTRSNVLRDLPIMVLSSIVLTIMLMDTYFDPSSEINCLKRSDGMLLLCFFLLFMYYTLRIARKERHKNEQIDISKIPPLWKCILLFLVGLACLIIGGNYMVDGASGIAKALGISEAVIALTIVSIGTSAPELATSLMAAKKGDNAMAVGNVVGSVVFNTLLVLGASSIVYPLPMQGITYVDLSVLVIASFLFWIFSLSGRKRFTLTRSEGAFMFICQIAYYAYLIYRA